MSDPPRIAKFNVGRSVAAIVGLLFVVLIVGSFLYFRSDPKKTAIPKDITKWDSELSSSIAKRITRTDLRLT